VKGHWAERKALGLTQVGLRAASSKIVSLVCAFGMIGIPTMLPNAVKADDRATTSLQQSSLGTVDSGSKSAETGGGDSNKAAVEATTGADYEYTVREQRQKSIPFSTVFHMDMSVAPGSLKVTKAGECGSLVTTYVVHYKGKTPVRFDVVSSSVEKAPHPEVITAGIRERDAQALPSRFGVYNRVRELEMDATAYTPNEGSGRGRCATGMRAGYGVVAVDPHVIPLRSRLYVVGYGYAVAGDTGGAIRGRRIDLGSACREEAMEIGRRSVHVYVLGDTASNGIPLLTAADLQTPQVKSADTQGQADAAPSEKKKEKVSAVHSRRIRHATVVCSRHLDDSSDNVGRHRHHRHYS